MTYATISPAGTRHRGLPQLLLALAAALLLLLAVAPAQAAGRVVWKKTTLEENEKREAWNLDLEMHMARPPDVAYVPMKFEFELLAVYERSLVDGKEDPVETTQPLSNQQPLIESSDVGFLDAGTGQIMTRTKFTFKVTRAHDFQAGEYKVTIRDTRDGSVVGTATTLKFKGKNPVVDRRSIVFTGTKKKKEEKTDDAPAPSTSSSGSNDSFDDADVPPDEDNAPPSVDERPGGGCHMSATPHSHYEWAGLAGLAGLALLVMTRRRRDR